MTDKIAFLGTGLMGAPMAERLLAAGIPLHVWNRSREKLAPLEKSGAIAGETPADTVRGADVVILMFDTADITRKALFDLGAAATMKPGALVIDMSSNDPETARQCARQLADAGIAHLDAPVSGGTAGAAAGTLAIMAGGRTGDFARALPIFEPMGRATHVGPSGAGQLAKLANQIIVAITIGAVSEALMLAKAGGADPAAVRNALIGGFADSKILQLHGERMIERRFQPGGTVTNQIKDLDAAERAASVEGLTLPLLAAVNTAFHRLASDGDADKDHSALYLWLERINAGDDKPGRSKA